MPETVFPPGLTNRQQQVAQGLWKGQTPTQIAERLDLVSISEPKKMLFDKLKINSVNELVVIMDRLNKQAEIITEEDVRRIVREELALWQSLNRG